MIVSIPHSELFSSPEVGYFLDQCFSVAVGRGFVLQIDGRRRSVVVDDWEQWLSCMAKVFSRWSAFSVPSVMYHVFRFIIDVDSCLYGVHVWYNHETKGINYGVA